MEQRASQLIGLMAHCGVRAGQTQPRSGRRNWRSLLPLFEIACVLMSSNHVACFVVNANRAISARIKKLNPTIAEIVRTVWNHHHFSASSPQFDVGKKEEHALDIELKK